MAFVNEKMTEEMRNDFEKRKISPDGRRIARPLYQTIDRENHICLWQLCTLDRDSFDHHYFLFERNGVSDILLLQYLNPSLGSVLWKPSYYQEFPDKDDMWKKDLIEALTTFGISGGTESISDIHVCVDLEHVEKKDIDSHETPKPFWKKLFRKRIIWLTIILVILLAIYGVVPK